MNNWDDLKLILALSRFGTMSAAARALGLSTATVSRRLERCTEEVGETLFVRRGQHWEPTAAAQIYVNLAEAVTDGFPQGQATKVEREKRVVRVSLPLDVCLDALSPHMPRFLQENPDLSIELFHDEKSIAFGEIDLKLCYVEPAEGRLIRMRLGSVGYRTYVSRQGNLAPEGWVEIFGFNGNSSPINKPIESKFGVPRVRTSSLHCAAELTETLPFVVNLPERFARRNSELTPWEPEEPTVHYPIWASYHESRKLDPDVRLLLGFMKRCFEENNSVPAP